MIVPEKLPNARYALQGVLFHVRSLTYRAASAKQIAALLDSAEYLPRLIASQFDETAKFRGVLENMATRYRCAYVLQRFDEPMPSKW